MFFKYATCVNIFLILMVYFVIVVDFFIEYFYCSYFSVRKLLKINSKTTDQYFFKFTFFFLDILNLV